MMPEFSVAVHSFFDEILFCPLYCFFESFDITFVGAWVSFHVASGL